MDAVKRECNSSLKRRLEMCEWYVKEKTPVVESVYVQFFEVFFLSRPV